MSACPAKVSADGVNTTAASGFNVRGPHCGTSDDPPANSSLDGRTSTACCGDERPFDGVKAGDISVSSEKLPKRIHRYFNRIRTSCGCCRTNQSLWLLSIVSEESEEKYTVDLLFKVSLCKTQRSKPRHYLLGTKCLKSVETIFGFGGETFSVESLSWKNSQRNQIYTSEYNVKTSEWWFIIESLTTAWCDVNDNNNVICTRTIKRAEGGVVHYGRSPSSLDL